MGLLLLGDLVALGGSFLVTLFLAFGTLEADTVLQHAIPFLILYVVWILIFYVFELYDIEYHRRGVHLYSKIAQALLVALLVSIAFFYMFPIFGITPRTNLAINITVFGGLFLIWRIIFSHHLTRRFVVKTIVIDPSQRLHDFVSEIAANPQLGLGQPIHATDFLSVDEHNHMQVIVDSQNSPSHILEKLLNHEHSVVDAITAYERYFQKIPINLITTKWIMYHIRKKQSMTSALFHAIFDRLIALIVIALTLPFTLITALIIYLEDRGPIFYTQTRTGQYGKPFELIKFRSMRTDAEKNGAQWSSGSSDSRVTRIGKIIRKLHIDEIPQMINILRGEIDLIGPRAERPEFVAKLEEQIPHYRIRHIIKPGFTGWAQIKFLYARSVMDSFEKFQYDLYYIKNRNLIMDFAILFRTAYIIIKH